MSKHTPGPWRCDSLGVITGGVDYCTGIAETYQVKWQMCDGGLGSFLSGPDRQQLVAEAKANGALIAAGPELLDALRYLQKTCDVLNNLHHAGIPIPEEDWSEAYFAAEGAKYVIAKAEGGEA